MFLLYRTAVPHRSVGGPYSFSSLVLVLGTALTDRRHGGTTPEVTVTWTCGCRAYGKAETDLMLEPCEKDRLLFRPPPG